MAITLENVEYISRLAKLEFNLEDKRKLITELSEILNYMEKLNELDTENIEPLSHPLDLVNVFRKDEVKPSFSPDEALSNAPSKKLNYFKVPKVIK
jgi:aspartyl-tRNA(Asn)/glutamyl-tRNA(Gln) amidotransferase subunit C